VPLRVLHAASATVAADEIAYRLSFDLSAPYGERGEVSGVTLLGHPRNPGFPQPWILRQRESMQNAVFPGREAVDVPTERPLVLRYRLVVHRGEARLEAIEEWQSELAKR
jgi:hypothetical protein